MVGVALAVEEVDPELLPEEDLRATHRLWQDYDDEYYPWRPPAPFEAYAHIARSHPRLPEVRSWVARRAGTMVGTAELEVWKVGQERPFAEISVVVDPQERRRGVATDLVHTLGLTASRAGLDLIFFAAVPDSPGAAFLAALGAKAVLRERANVLYLADLDTALLDAWITRAPERAAAYSLVSWDGPCRQDLLGAYAALRQVMNTAPRGEAEWDDFRWTPETARSYEQTWSSQGHRWWTLVARHDPSGTLVGFTEIVFRAERPGVATQEDTGVDPSHRGLGLGRWLKAAMLKRLLAERPDVGLIETGNAGSNAPMLAINDALGFRCLAEVDVYQIPTDDLLASTERPTARS